MNTILRSTFTPSWARTSTTLPARSRKSSSSTARCRPSASTCASPSLLEHGADVYVVIAAGPCRAEHWMTAARPRYREPGLLHRREPGGWRQAEYSGNSMCLTRSAKPWWMPAPPRHPYLRAQPGQGTGFQIPKHHRRERISTGVVWDLILRRQHTGAITACTPRSRTRNFRKGRIIVSLPRAPAPGPFNLVQSSFPPGPRG